MLTSQKEQETAIRISCCKTLSIPIKSTAVCCLFFEVLWIQDLSIGGVLLYATVKVGWGVIFIICIYMSNNHKLALGPGGPNVLGAHCVKCMVKWLLVIL